MRPYFLWFVFLFQLFGNFYLSVCLFVTSQRTERRGTVTVAQRSLRLPLYRLIIIGKGFPIASHFMQRYAATVPVSRILRLQLYRLILYHHCLYILIIL